jgi:hypothetical protein
MPILAPEFEYDVFVSYAHGDVRKMGNAALKRWSYALVDALEEELALDGDDAKFFLDASDIDRHRELDKEIREAILASATMLVLMSPRYLASDACKTERALWFEKATSEALAEGRERILFARVLPVRDGDWPSEFLDGSGAPPISRWFFEQPGAPKARPFGWPDFTAASREFRDEVVALAGDISVQLRNLKETIDRKKRAVAYAQKLREATGQALYLHARQRDLSEWESVRSRLISAGYGVAGAPEQVSADPACLEAFDKESVRILTACDGLLLVAGEDLDQLASDIVVVGRQRRNLAIAKSKKPLPCAVVDHHFSADEKAILQQLARNMQVDWINSTASNWVGDIRAWLNRTI